MEKQFFEFHDKTGESVIDTFGITEERAKAIEALIKERVKAKAELSIESEGLNATYSSKEFFLAAEDIPQNPQELFYVGYVVGKKITLVQQLHKEIENSGLGRILDALARR